MAAVCQDISWVSFSLLSLWVGARSDMGCLSHSNCTAPAGVSPATPQDESVSWPTVSYLHGNLSEGRLVSHRACVRF